MTTYVTANVTAYLMSPMIKLRAVIKKAKFTVSTLIVATVAAVPLMLSVSTPAIAAGGGFALESPSIDTSNKRSLQRGAKAYVNYCMGCHTADYQRYSRLATDLGLSEDDVANNLIFTTDKAGETTKVGSLMFNNMSTDYGRQAFGVAPPNLALTARSRGEDWIYTYLKSFYRDESRAGVGVNNLVYPGAAMPHVLWEQQGWQEPVYDGEGDAKTFTGFKQVSEGSLSSREYDVLITDITTFMSYMADPIKQTRHRIGMLVMLFLLVLTAISYLLKKEYWKDVV